MKKAVILWLVLLAAGLPSAAAATEPRPEARPHISANPTGTMVNQAVRLRGSGFAKNAQITLSECSRKSWAPSQGQCLASNEVTLRTNGAGAFKTSLQAQVCEAPSTGATRARKGPTERSCYIGEVEPGASERAVLCGAVKIHVSWP